MQTYQESSVLDRAEAMKAVNRCAEAYYHVTSELAPGANHVARDENKDKAREAFLRNLPILLDRGDFQIYIACIGVGVNIQAIDIVDGARYCHIAITAMQAWKLAHAEELQAAHPPSSRGNQHEDYQRHDTLRPLPDRKTQDFYFKELRRRGLPVPNEPMLRNNPDAALAFCELYEQHRDKFPPPEREFIPAPTQKPGDVWLNQPTQAETAA